MSRAHETGCGRLADHDGPCSGLPSVDPAVLEEARDLAARAILLQEDAASQIYWDDAGDSDRAQAVEDAQYAVRAAARAIAAAAYRQGREDLEARIEELAEVHEIKASITESDRKARELDRRAELLRSLLTDKEDNNE